MISMNKIEMNKPDGNETGNSRNKEAVAGNSPLLFRNLFAEIIPVYR